MVDDTEIARVAAGLTRAQREAFENWHKPGILSWPTKKALAEKGLVALDTTDHLTQKGCALLDHILREKSGG